MHKSKKINDVDLLLDFIEWLPDLEPTEKFYVALFARKKYDETLQSTASDKMQLKRLLCTKENMLQKIRQLEIDYGLYNLKSMIATQESLALYITPNPRCMIKAHKLMLKKLVDAVCDKNYFHNIHAEAISCVQKAKSYSYVVDFDIDDKEIDLFPIKDILPPNAYKILETRGGYHLLVHPSIASDLHKWDNPGIIVKNWGRDWHKKITTTFPCDMTGDQMMPVVGCTQGGFTPKFIK